MINSPTVTKTGDANRLEILRLVKQWPYSPTTRELARELEVKQPAVVFHLKLLKGLGLVDWRQGDKGRILPRTIHLTLAGERALKAGKLPKM